MVEFVLATTFMVPVLLYGNYLSDALFAGLKAQEATAAAAWDFSGRLLHDYDSFNHAGKYSAAATDEQSQTTANYQGLDAWAVLHDHQHPTEQVGVSAKSTLIATSGKVCSQGGYSGIDNPSNLGDLPVVGAELAGLTNKLHGAGSGGDGFVRCQTQVKVTNWLFGQATHQGEILRSKMWPSSLLGSITLCGVGTASGSACASTGQAFALYTDDWGLSQDGNANSDDTHTNFPDENQAISKHFASLGTEVFESEAPVPYPKALQIAEGAGSIVTLVDPIPLLDVEYDSLMSGRAQGLFNLAERRTADSTIMTMNTPFDSANQCEGSFPQPSYTAPVKHWAAGSIPANAYYNSWHARTGYYLGE